jgi:site-specific recombinase XerD
MSGDLVAKFLKKYGVPVGETKKPLSGYQRRIRTSLRILEEFALYGHWQRRRSVKAKAPFPPAFEAEAKAFIEYRRIDCCLSRTTLYMTRHHLLLFASFMKSRHVKSWRDLQPRDIPPFFASQTHMQPTTLVGLASTIRKFLNYLWLQKTLPSDFSGYVPKFRRCYYHHIPSVWKQDDVKALLAVVDRGSALGKRDYAILILVTRLGLRVGEIRTLKFENIHWEKAELEIFQPKTKNTVLLPLSEEIGQALIDYIRNGRPPVTCREIFVRHIAPFEPFANDTRFHYIITAYRQKAHIPVDVPRHRGLHSLRFTLATRLLEEGTPMETIAAILGHTSVETTRIYTKVDLKALQDVALDPEEVRHE